MSHSILARTVLALLALAACDSRADRESPPAGGVSAIDPLADAATARGTSVFACTDPEEGDFSFTITDFEMGPQEVGLWLPSRFGQVYHVLERNQDHRGFRSRDGRIRLLTTGEVAELEVEDQAYGGCRLDTKRSVWEHAKLTGVDFRATGNEPGWHLEIRDDLETRAGKRILFVYDYGQKQAVLHTSGPVVEDEIGRTVYRGESGGQWIVIEINGDPCSDSMSGDLFESTVNVEFQGSTYRGCGKALH